MPEVWDFATAANLYPKQQEFFRTADEKTYTLFGGAKGPGKSRSLRWYCVYRLLLLAQRGIRGARAAIFCEDYNVLHDRHISRWRAEFPDHLGDLNVQRSEFRLSDRYGGGIVSFRNLDDPSKYNGVEFAVIAVDEIAKDPRIVFDQLRSCLRWPGVEDVKFVCATNPEGGGLAWVRKLWIERDFSEPDDKLDPDDFAFVHANAYDNKALPESYYKSLETLPDNMRRAYLEGDWYVFEGQFFNEWRPKLHIVDPFEIPDTWPTWGGLDYGTGAPFCWLHLAQDPASGRRYAIDELYRPGLTAVQQAELVLEKLYRFQGTYLYTNADPSMFFKTIQDAASFTAPADHYVQVGVPLRKANNARIQGWNNVREALRIREDGKPALQVFRNCKNLIRTIPMMIYDEDNPEDLDSDLEDHGVDSLRYGLSLSAEVMHRRTLPRKRRAAIW